MPNQPYDNEKYRLIVKRATDIAIWAGSHVNGIQVPNPNIRKRLAGSSFALSIDLYGSMCCLAAFDGKSGVYLLARSIVENYARGFWLASIAKDDEIKKYAARRLTMTLKPLLKVIRNSKFEQQSRLGIDETNSGVLDSLAHGDIGQMLLRNINGTEIGSSANHVPSIGLLFTGASIAVTCVENYVREILDDEPRSRKVFEEGMILVSHLAEWPVADSVDIG